MFTDLQNKFIETFSEEFFRELHFIVDIDRGRAQKRKTFFEKLTGKISYGFDMIDKLSGFFPVIGEISKAKKFVNFTVSIFQYFFEKNIDTNIQAVIAGARQPALLLKLLLEWVARQLARRHEFFINHMCAPESIDFFAMVGVARVLQYLSDHKDLEFTPENLLRGAIQGRSGSGQQGFKNNKLKIQHPNRKTLDAETVYGRSALMSLAARYFFKAAPRMTFRETFGYVEVENKLPIAGVMVLTPEELEEYAYEEAVIFPELRDYLQNYTPKFRYATKREIVDYLEAVRERGNMGSFVEYCGDCGVLVREDLSGMNLSQGDFSGVDFTGSNFSHTNLSRASFEGAYLVGVSFQNIIAHRSNFRAANLSLVDASEGIFLESDFVGAKIHYASFVKADLSGVHYLGADWYGTDLSEIKVEEVAGADLARLRNVTQDLLVQQASQHLAIEAIESTVREHSENLTRIEIQYQDLAEAQTEARFELGQMIHDLMELQERLEAEISTSSRADIQAQVLEIEKQISAASWQAQSLRNEFQTLGRSLGEFQAQLLSQKLEQEHFQARLSELDSRVDAVQASQLAFKARLEEFQRLKLRFNLLENAVLGHETQLRLHTQQLRALEKTVSARSPEQQVLSVKTAHHSSKFFGGASSSRGMSPETSSTDEELKRVYRILQDYPPFPGYACTLHPPTLQHPSVTLRYIIPYEEDFHFVYKAINKTKALKFQHKKLSQLSGGHHSELILVYWNLDLLSSVKEELPRYLEAAKMTLGLKT